MKKNLLFFALAVGLLASAPTLQAQVNISRYITLTVKRGEAIQLAFTAAVAGTPVRIVSGSNTYDIIAGNTWLKRNPYTAGSTTMTIYGDITAFVCRENRANLTAIDVSHNTQLTYLDCATNKLTVLDVSDNTKLTKLNCYSNNLNTLDVSNNTKLKSLYCYDNNFSTATLDDIYCALPDRTGNTNGVIVPVKNSSSSNNATVIATNRANATAKNWRVLYSDDNTYADVPTTGTYVCSLNMSRYITLTVKRGKAIKLDFAAASAGTPIRIVSGSNTQDITVGTSWYNGNWPSTYTVTAAASTMKIYGDITNFNCQQNGANLTDLDLSHNTQLTDLRCEDNKLSSLDVSNNTKLKYLYCYRNRLSNLDVSGCTQLEQLWCDNNNLSSLDVSKNTQLRSLECYDNAFTTQALNDIYCDLPDRTGKDNGVITPVKNSSSSNNATVIATNRANATAKNWRVLYRDDNTYADVPTTGTYVCPLNMSRYITLTVERDSTIHLFLSAATNNTPVRIVRGNTTQNITVGTSSTYTTITAAGTTIKVYGDITDFSCDGNHGNLTAIDVSHNTELTSLSCQDNRLSSLDVSNNTKLTKLICFRNRLSSLIVVNNVLLKELNCYSNNLNTLDVSQNMWLEELYCSNNQLSILSVWNNGYLTKLDCSNNRLSSLDLSNNTDLKILYCYGNAFTTDALDDIYCALPDRRGKEEGDIEPVYDSSSSNHATVLATNKQNATAKNWKVQYRQDNTDILTNGIYVCGTPHIEPNMSRYITLTVGSGEAIRLNFKAAADGTPVRIVSGSNTQDITVGTGWIGYDTYTANGTTMTIYGNLTGFACEYNGANLTALDVSKNTQLTALACQGNNLSSLDVSHNTQLTTLWCFSNLLTSLDVSRNTQLTKLYCYKNNFTTAALDDIYCALPDRTGKTNGVIKPVYNSSDPNHATVLATNKQNAIDKNWKVQYYDDNTDIPATTGSYVCSGGGTTTYDLKIAGVQVTSANRSDLSVIPDVSGTVKYDPSTKTLTLQNATIQKNTNQAILSEIDGLTIKVIGTNNLTTGSSATLSFRDPLTITGGGVLNAKSGGDCGIYAIGTNLTIDGCTVNAKGVYGIAGNSGSNENLTIINATVTAEGADYGSIADFASLTLDGCAITEPAGAAFDASLHAVALGGSVVTSKVVISPTGGEPNMSRYITLTVADSAEIRLDFKAAAAGTPVRIVSGSNTQDITVGTDWTSTASYTAYGTTMTVYGTIISFDCKNNGARITALDVSNNTQLTGLWCQDNNLNSLDVSKNTQLTHLSCSSNRLSSLDVSKNTQLTALYCYKNDFTTAALDDIYCALPDKTGEWYGVIEPLHNSSDPNHATVLATNKANAIDKNWKVQYYADDTDIPATTGTYECPELNMNRYITLTVGSGKAIKLDFRAAANATPVRIVSGSTTQDITVGTDWYNDNTQSTFTVTADGTEMKVYGDLTGFSCGENFGNLTALDASNNKSLTQLYCFENQLSSLNISKNRALDTLSCNESQLASLDVSNNTNLKYLNCSDNQLTNLDVSKNTQLTNLSCSENNLDSLDVSKNTELTGLSCSDNKLRDLDVSKNTKLEWLYCAKNPLDSLDVSRNTRLTDLHCYSNQLSSLDVSNNRLLETLECNSNRLTDLNVLQNKRLTQLYCYSNKLSSLSIKRNTQLEKLYCWDNNFSTQALDDIYCALPNRTGKDNGEIFPLRDTSSAAEVDSVGATTAKNATDKNWKVWKYNQVGGNTDITTNGSYDCSTAVADATAEQALTLYPNPVADVLYLSATARTVRIYNIYGIEVARATDTDKVEVSHLPAGVYTVKADGTVAKMVKR